MFRVIIDILQKEGRPAMDRTDVLRKECIDEFKEIITDYILPLFDTRGNMKFVKNDSTSSRLIAYDEDAGKKRLRFYPYAGNDEIAPFYLEIGTYSMRDVIRPSANILRELLRVAEYGCRGERFYKKNDYGKNEKKRQTYKKRAFDLAFEMGMCIWLTQTAEDAATLHRIVYQMTEWAGKTYEGKNVAFGLVVDFGKEEAADTVSYIHFLKNDSSAVFTDGIFSGILLDKAGRLSAFLTRNTTPPQVEIDVFVPYQYVDIAQHCVGKRIGIIVLTNGEILLIRNRSVCFVRRGSKWVYFCWHRVFQCLRPYFLQRISDEEMIEKRIKEIYKTMLDVSFSHTGGCLALVTAQDADLSHVIKDRFDLSIAGQAPAGISEENKEKIEILKYLIADEKHNVRSFFDLDQPLRREILSLDGATVVSLDGSFYCAGSIVALNSKSSSGGGRTAAAKQLAQFGVGIKISEDGYIEAYAVPLAGELAPQKKPSRYIQLFKFK